MTPFSSLTAIAAAIPVSDVDTDQLAPARFLKTVSRSGLGDAMLHAMRFDAQGVERPDFVLNRHPWRQAQILVALDNFGCGSSREHAVWALGGFGMKVVIAPSFGDIFRNNCLQNGLLPIRMDGQKIPRLIALAQDPETACFHVSLPDQTISAGGEVFAFPFDPVEKERLLTGTDTLSRSLALMEEVEKYENMMGPDPLPPGLWRS